jgi:hypothetical protein
MGERESWAHVVSGLGLEVYFGPKYVQPSGFHQIKHSLHPTGGALYEPTKASGLFSMISATGAFWAHGECNGVEVIAGIPWESVSETDADGNSSSHDEPRTCVHARIHPALVLGLDYDGRASAFSSGIAAIEPQRAAQLLRPIMGDGTDVAEQLRRATARGNRVHINDTSVSLVAREVRTRELRGLLEGTALVATRLAQARRLLPPNAVEQAVLAAWGAFAQAEGLSLDPAAFVLHGRARGADLSVSLWAVRRSYLTDFRVRLAAPPSQVQRLSIRREQTFEFLSKWLNAEVQTGDKAFDKEFFLDGAPDAAVRALLTDAVRARVRDVMQWAAAITFSHDMIWVHVPSPVFDPAALRRSVEATVALAAAIAPGAPATPYR